MATEGVAILRLCLSLELDGAHQNQDDAPEARTQQCACNRSPRSAVTAPGYFYELRSIIAERTPSMFLSVRPRK